METLQIPPRPPRRYLDTIQPDVGLVAEVESAFDNFQADPDVQADESLARSRGEEPLSVAWTPRKYGRAAELGRYLVEKLQDGYNYANARIGLGYGALMERAQAKAAQASEKSVRPSSAKVWLMGALAVNMIVSRTHGFGLLDELHGNGIGSLPVVEANYRPLAAHSDLTTLPARPETANALPSVIVVEPAPPSDRVILRWGDLDGNGVDDWEQFKASANSVGHRLQSWFVTEASGPYESAPPTTRVDDPTISASSAPTSSPLPTETAVPIPSPTVVPVPGADAQPGIVIPPVEGNAPSSAVGNGSLEANLYDLPPRDDEYLWNYMDRIGIPHGVIMRELDEAADRLKGTTTDTVQWHGSGHKRWLEINGKTDSLSLWRILQANLKAVA